MLNELNKHTIGILGGMGPAASANFLRLLTKSFNEVGICTDSEFPRIVMLSLPLEDWDNTGSTKKSSVERQIKEGLCWLSRNDAEVIAIPCNTVHEFIENEPRIVNIIESALSECLTFPVGILCSRQTRESDLYERVLPSSGIYYFSDQNEVDDVIANAMAGKFEDISPFIEDAWEAGAKTVIFGCTEFSLCPMNTCYHIPIVDSTAALARAVVKRTLAL